MKKLNKRGFVLLETVIVSVFIVSIFTFIYVSVVPLLGRYEDLTRDYDIDAAYKLYHVRDAIYKDSNFANIVKSDYKSVVSSDFTDTSYYNSLTSSLFEDSNYQVIYVRKLKNRVASAVSSLSVTGGFKEYIEKIARTKAEGNMQNFIFLENEGNYAYLGLAVDLNDTTNYEDPEEIDLNNHVDPSNPNPPLLMEGMIPIWYDENDKNWYKADSKNKSSNYPWYNYPNFQWANIALVKESVRETYQQAPIGTLISNNDIIGYYVWIPRYEYVIKGNYGEGGTSASSPGEISVNFIDTSVAKKRTVDSYTWRTASAFTFGEDELTGFWFAKFEMSNSELKGYVYNGNSVPFVLPETYSWTGLKFAQFYQKITNYMNGDVGSKIYGLTSSLYTSDAHTMKNEEWGAVAYLSQSKYGKYGNPNFSGSNKEIYINNRQSSGNDISITTGSSAGYPTYSDGSSTSSEKDVVPITKECSSYASNTSVGCYKYFVEGAGTGASTTGTIYGIYDMSGGTAEFVMGATGLSTSYCGSRVYVGAYTEFTGFKGPYSYGTASACNSDSNDIDFPTDDKYYYVYARSLKYGCSKNSMIMQTSDEICYSHAMGETSGWYGDYAEKLDKDKQWYTRGGIIADSSGIFSLFAFSGSKLDTEDVDTSVTTRPIIAVY